MKLLDDQIIVETEGRGFYELTDTLRAYLERQGTGTGLVHCYCLHTSASLVITENADPAVLRDLESFISRLVPDGTEHYEHSAEGADDMPAHIRSVLTRTELSLPVREGRLDLGTWQGIYLWEHRARPHQRTIRLTILGGSD